MAVARRLHFRRAAEELHIAQPALSRHIATLERELGTPLFTRSPVTLTAAGRQLLADAEPLLDAADAAIRRARRAARQLTVGFRAGIVITHVIRAFQEIHPDVSVDVVRLEWDEQEEAIRTGRVDVAFARPPVSGAHTRLLYTEPRFVALPVDHPLAAEPELREADLADLHHLKWRDPDPITGAQLRTVEEKLEHVAACRGIIVLPRSATRYYSRPDIVYVPVVDAEPDQVLLAWAVDSNLVSAFAQVSTASRIDHAAAS